MLRAHKKDPKRPPIVEVMVHYRAVNGVDNILSILNLLITKLATMRS